MVSRSLDRTPSSHFHCWITTALLSTNQKNMCSTVYYMLHMMFMIFFIQYRGLCNSQSDKKMWHYIEKHFGIFHLLCHIMIIQVASPLDSPLFPNFAFLEHWCVPREWGYQGI